MTILEISRAINLNRNSVAKYLDVLLISGQVEMRPVGRAKMYYLSQRVPISAMLNYSSDYILVLDSDLKTIQANDNLLNLLNTKRKAIVGLGIESSPCHVFTSQKMLSRIKRALNGKDSTTELKSQISDGEFYFNTKIIPTTFDDGSQGVTLCMEDITERKKVEYERNELLRDYDERVKELSCLYEISKLVEKPGISLERILQETVDLLPFAWQYPDITCARIVFQEREFKCRNFKETRWKLQADINAHGKRTATVEVYYLEEKPTIDEGPFLKEERILIDAIAERLARIIERYSYITERKLAEEALRESEAKYSAVVENTSDGIVVIQDGMLKFVNSASLELVGYSPEELIETDFINRIAQEHRETVMNRYTGLLKGEDVPTIFEITLLRKDGSTFPVELNAARIDYEGRPAVLVFLRKITERKKSEGTASR